MIKRAPKTCFWKKRLLSLLSFALFFSSTAYGATRYIDNSGSPACSDSPSFGSEANPWCTISYAFGQLAGGDTLYVKNGTYNEIPYFSGPSGSATQDTMIAAYPGDSPIIRGFGNNGRVKFNAVNYVTFDGFEVTNLNQGIWVDTASTHITIKNCKVHDIGQEAIHITANSSYVTVDHCTIYNTNILSGGTANGEGVYIGSGSAGSLDNTNHVVVKNNLIHDVTDEAVDIKPGTHDVTVDGNIIYNATTNSSWQPTWGAIEISESMAGNQSWTSNPNHVVKNNIIHDSKTAIRPGTGCTVYNNVIYNAASGRYGIYTNNIANDTYTRKIYHNTVDVASSNAIVTSSGTADIRNNIGPSTTDNIAASNAYYVNKSTANYHLIAGSAPINAGVDLTSVVPVDIEGNSRLIGSSPDLGAYEYASTSALSPPQNLTVR